VTVQSEEDVPNVKPIKVPPKEIQIRQMTDDQRRQFSLPTEEDLARVPARQEIWHRLMEGAEMIEPELTVLPYRHPIQQSGWAGVTLTSPVPDSPHFSSAAAYFNAPVVTARQWGVGVVSTWVGISTVDGGSESALVQAGIDSLVADVWGFWNPTDAWAWVEWFPQTAVGWSNIPVHQGDELFVDIDLPSESSANIYMANVSKHLMAGCSVNANPGQELTNPNEAAWIAENADSDQLIGTSLPHFSTITFTSAVAVLDVPNPGFLPAFVPVTTGTTWEIVNHEDQVQASGSICGADCVRITST
jgi:Peptidase A4 family